LEVEDKDGDEVTIIDTPGVGEGGGFAGNKQNLLF